MTSDLADLVLGLMRDGRWRTSNDVGLRLGVPKAVAGQIMRRLEERKHLVSQKYRNADMRCVMWRVRREGAE